MVSRHGIRVRNLAGRRPPTKASRMASASRPSARRKGSDPATRTARGKEAALGVRPDPRAGMAPAAGRAVVAAPPAVAGTPAVAASPTAGGTRAVVPAAASAAVPPVAAAPRAVAACSEGWEAAEGAAPCRSGHQAAAPRRWPAAVAAAAGRKNEFPSRPPTLDTSESAPAQYCLSIARPGPAA